MKKGFLLLPLAVLITILLGTLSTAQAAGPGGSISVRFYDEASGSYADQTAVDLVALTLNDETLNPGDVPAIVQYPDAGSSGRTLVPVRLVGEQLGAEVIWIPENRQVLLLQGENTIVLTLGSATALVNGEEAELPDGVPAGVVKYNGRESTMVPLRFVSEQLGAQIAWENATFTASITTVPPEVEDPDDDLLPDVGVVTGIFWNGSTQTVQVVADHAPTYRIIDLGNRLVVDVLGVQMPNADYLTHTIPAGGDLVSSIRYAQHGDGLDYGYAHTLRIVLDLKKGITYTKNVTVSGQAGGILITVYQSDAGQGDPSLPSTPIDPDKTTIVVDPGHGGIHPGAVYEGILEKDLTLSISLKLRDELTARGYNVIMMRDDDTTVDIYDRADIANALGADLFVSIHCNASGTVPDYQGIYTYYYPGSTLGGAELAAAIQEPLCQLTGAIDRGIRSANLVVLRETEMCAVLVETGFMSNSEELARLCDESYQLKIAQGVAEGVTRYLNAQPLFLPETPATTEPSAPQTDSTPANVPAESPAA